MNPDSKCIFSAKSPNKRFVCRLVGTVAAECDGALLSRKRCPFWSISHQLCRMMGRGWRKA